MTELQIIFREGLRLIAKLSPENWKAKMSQMPEVQRCGISVNDLWAACYYIRYTWYAKKTENAHFVTYCRDCVHGVFDEVSEKYECKYSKEQNPPYGYCQRGERE